MEQKDQQREFVSWRRWSDGGEGEEDGPNGTTTHPLFTELAHLSHDNWGRLEWKEVARWVKFEEDVEECGLRWSKPFVPTIALTSLRDLTLLFKDNTNAATLLLVDHPAIKYINIIWNAVVDKWISTMQLSENDREQVLHALTSRKAHLFQQDTGLHLNGFTKSKRRRPESRRGSDAFRMPNYSGDRRKSFVAVSPQVGKPRSRSESSTPKSNTHFLKKMTTGSESFIILVGELNCLDKPTSVFIRLSEGIILNNLTEVPLPTRFIFVLLGPTGQLGDYHEMGRALATAMLDSTFREVAYTLKTSKEFALALENYSNTTTVLPPEWDPGIRIEPQPMADDDDDDADSIQMLEAAGLKRTGRLFGGFLNDIKRKLPWYLSDFRDAISLQCIATWLFLYFACLTPIITFGGLLGEATHNLMGTMETIVAACICGISFALFAGQPLLILGATGPMLVFEKILIQICDDFPDLELNYLELRLCIGIWVGIILMILVAMEVSSFVAYITKFTEENFATLISIIFMVEAIKNLSHIAHSHAYVDANVHNNSINDLNDRILNSMEFGNGNSTVNESEIIEPTNVFLLSILLFLGTFFVSFLLKEFRSSSFLSTRARYTISDFAVILAITAMSGINAGVGLPVPRLTVPSQFAPTIPTRGWFILPFRTNPTWTVFAAIIPAALATILIFMDQQITAVIINRKSYKLKKGAGYHLDLFVLACLIVTNSFLGLPWLVAATVESVTNVGSLKLESEATAPGEKPHFLGVREQRVSNLLVYTTVGLSVFLTPLLRHVPMPVLFGVFLYMGFSAIRRMELFDRILLFIIPPKYQPDHIYIRQVPIRKIHLYTMIQCSCLVLLWIIKSISATAILFPVMLVVMMGVRKALDLIFTQNELAALDDILPLEKQRRAHTKEKNEELVISDATRL